MIDYEKIARKKTYYLEYSVFTGKCYWVNAWTGDRADNYYNTEQEAWKACCYENNLVGVENGLLEEE